MDLKIFGKIWFLWFCSVLLNIITLLIISYKIKPSGDILALHYNIISGVDWYGEGFNIYQIPLVGFFVTFVNFIFYFFTKGKSLVFSGLAPMTSLGVQVILLFATVLLAKLN